MKTLEEFLTYKNPYIIREFQRKNARYNLNEADAQTLFEDMLRYLWLTGHYEDLKKAHTDRKFPDISITQSMIIIDEMWHEFILVTEHYVDFCEKYYGSYIHHPPAMPRFAENRKTMSEEECMEIFIEDVMSVVYDELGAEVTLRWFNEYHEYLPDNYLAEMSHHHG